MPKNKEKNTVDVLNNNLTKHKMLTNLDSNIKMFESLFQNVETMKKREIKNKNNNSLRYWILYCDGLVDNIIINENIIKPLIIMDNISQVENLIDQLNSNLIFANEIKKTSDVQEIVEAVTYGDTLLLAEGCKEGLIINSKSFELRAIAEPEGEKVLAGPREGFTEGIISNLSMLHRRLRTNNFKVRFKTLGVQSNTSLCICYLDNIVNKNILKELYKRLDKIQIDGILDSNYITEFIAPSSIFGFSNVYSTERPDIVVSKLLEGRIALIIDGSPMVLTLPVLFIENFQSNEDYYVDYLYTSLSRILRIMAFILAISIPGIYIAIVTFHYEILPTALIINMAKERSNVPLPEALETFIMLIVFDILRETGIRMPTYIGQALSIVGAIVVGEAAVEANLVAAPVIIVVALTGITGLLIPKLRSPAIVLRFFLLICGTTFGLLGFVIGFSIIVIHIINLNSFGISQFTSLNNLRFQDVKDTLIRAPWPKMLTRPSVLTKNITRIKPLGSSKQKGD